MSICNIGSRRVPGSRPKLSASHTGISPPTPWRLSVNPPAPPQHQPIPLAPPLRGGIRIHDSMTASETDPDDWRHFRRHSKPARRKHPPRFPPSQSQQLPAAVAFLPRAASVRACEDLGHQQRRHAQGRQPDASWQAARRTHPQQGTPRLLGSSAPPGGCALHAEHHSSTTLARCRRAMQRRVSRWRVLNLLCRFMLQAHCMRRLPTAQNA